jgi:hypothetical protein
MTSIPPNNEISTGQRNSVSYKALHKIKSIGELKKS